MQLYSRFSKNSSYFRHIHHCDFQPTSKMKLFHSGMNALVFLLGLFATSYVAANESIINIYSDNYCSNYKTGAVIAWNSMQNSGGNCYFNNAGFGASVNIGTCNADHGYCMCRMYYNNGCTGDYATLQYGQHDTNKDWEWNCIFNGASFKSVECFIW